MAFMFPIICFGKKLSGSIGIDSTPNNDACRSNLKPEQVMARAVAFSEHPV